MCHGPTERWRVKPGAEAMDVAWVLPPLSLGELRGKKRDTSRPKPGVDAGSVPPA